MIPVYQRNYDWGLKQCQQLLEDLVNVIQQGRPKHFFGAVVGRCQSKLTEAEQRMGLEPRWLPVEEALQIFSRHADYTDTDEERRGIYQREYTALSALLQDGPGDR